MGSIFTKIINREIPATILFEDDNFIAIKDINPVAPVHILIITKKEIPDLQSIKSEDAHLLSDIIQVAQKLAEENNIADGYRLLTNNGTSAGQTIFHLHFHLIGGRPLGALA